MARRHINEVNVCLSAGYADTVLYDRQERYLHMPDMPLLHTLTSPLEHLEFVERQ